MEVVVGDSPGFVTQLALVGAVPVDRNQRVFQPGSQCEVQGNTVRMLRLASFSEPGLAHFSDSFRLGSSWDNWKYCYCELGHPKAG